MTDVVNPYEPVSSRLEADSQVDPMKRSEIVFWMILWTLESSVKVAIVFFAFSLGEDLTTALTRIYQQTHPLTFLAVGWFLLVETIGPLIGLLFFTRPSIRALPAHAALLRVLITAALSALVVTLAIMSYAQYLIS